MGILIGEVDAENIARATAQLSAMIRSSLGSTNLDDEAADIAARFCELDDDHQAKVFVNIAKIMDSWPRGSFARHSQAHFIGGHLRNCPCSTDEARELILEIADAIKTSNHGIELGTPR